MQYTHQAIELEEQLATLQKYGLSVKDKSFALKTLRSISYFRIACYLKYYEVAEHQYQSGSDFSDGVRLYAFDNELKGIIFKAIQDVEVALRTRMIHYISIEQGPFWFMTESCFSNHEQFHGNLEKLRTELKRSKEDFISEHMQKYDSPTMPPAWKTMEVASLGTLSKIYESLETTDAKKDVARSFGLPQYKYLESWNRSITVLRNCLAHHARVWNRRFTVKPQMPDYLPGKWIGNAGKARLQKLYAQLCVLAYMEQTISPNCNFVKQIVDLIHRHPEIDVKAMGFPNGWENEPLWRMNKEIEQLTIWKKIKSIFIKHEQ